MAEKSHVGLEMHLCPVCAQKHDVGVILHRRLSPVLDRENITGWSMCPEHAKLKEEGYIALVGIDEAASVDHTPGGVYRTGDIAHIRASAWDKVFINAELPPRGMAFVEPKVIEMLKAKQVK